MYDMLKAKLDCLAGTSILYLNKKKHLKTTFFGGKKSSVVLDHPDRPGNPDHLDHIDNLDHLDHLDHLDP